MKAGMGKNKVREKKGRKEGRKKQRKKQRKEERKNLQRCQCCPAIAIPVPLLLQYIPDASQLLALKKSSRLDAKCENPAMSDPEVKSTK
jgi:hypothetical protein